MAERLSSCGKTGSSRREFLQTAGKLAASSALLAGRLPAVHAREDNTIQLDLVGGGALLRTGPGSATSAADKGKLNSVIFPGMDCGKSPGQQGRACRQLPRRL